MRDFLILALLSVVIVASGLDIWSDLSHGASLSHVVQEAVIMLFAAGLLVSLVRELGAQRRKLARLNEELDLANQPQKQRSPALDDAARGLREAVESQFDDWGLTASEREVGWLLLKGLSTREIAELRSTQEKTARQQASSIYQKAGLSGRHAFAAWFIEDLM